MKSIKLFFILAFLLGLQQPLKAQYHEGDTLHFWSVTYVDWPPLWGAPQHLVTAICKKAGLHCYVFVETTATQPSQASIDTLVYKFDHHFVPDLVPKYGPVPDVFDHDSNVFILAFNESSWSGYFDPGQQMSDSMVMATWNRHSNEREMIYIAANDFEYGAEGIISHEFGHLLHWGQDHSPEPANPGIYWEVAFVDEGFSTFAAEFLTANLYQHNVYDGWAFFQSDPDIPLIYFSSYDQAEIFMIFMFEHYGGWNYISSLISNQLNSWQGVDSTMHMLGYTQHFEDAFEQWCIANYIDDTVYQGGKYSYAHFNFPAALNTASYLSFPTGVHNEMLTPFGCDYIVFSSTTPKPIEIEFSGDPASKYRLAFIMMNPTGGGVHKVVSIPLDSANHAVFMADSLGIAYNKVIMAAMNVDTGLDTLDVANYSYSAWQTSGTGDETSEKIGIWPNPAHDMVNVSVMNTSMKAGEIQIFDNKGNQIMCCKYTGRKKAIKVSGFAPGIYIVKTIIEGKTFCGRFVKE
jgi:hypothetical protein